MDFADSNGNPQSFLMQIMADYSYVYDNLWIDTSAFSALDASTVYTAYKPVTSWPQNLVGQKNDHFILTFQ